MAKTPSEMSDLEARARAFASDRRRENSEAWLLIKFAYVAGAKDQAGTDAEILRQLRAEHNPQDPNEAFATNRLCRGEFRILASVGVEGEGT